MANMDDYECPVEGCPKAYPHSLLTDAHVVSDHEEWLDDIIEGNRSVDLN